VFAGQTGVLALDPKDDDSTSAFRADADEKFLVLRNIQLRVPGADARQVRRRKSGPGPYGTNLLAPALPIAELFLSTAAAPFVALPSAAAQRHAENCVKLVGHVSVAECAKGCRIQPPLINTENLERAMQTLAGLYSIPPTAFAFEVR
jgi:hypothetical protein